jgi:hypothetical protein
VSDTPETDKVWKAGIKMSAEESEDFLRQHAERLERERDQARIDELDESKWAKHYFEACQNLERERDEARRLAEHYRDSEAEWESDEKDSLPWEKDQIGPCKRPDLCLLDHGHIPCPVCPNRKR